MALLLSAWSAAFQASAADLYDAELYDGRYVASHGGVFFEIKYNNESSFRRSDRFSRVANVALYHESSQTFHQILQKDGRNRQRIDDVWLLEPGTYRLAKVSLVDANGRERSYFVRSKSYISFVVKPAQISNLGKLVISTSGDGRIGVKIVGKALPTLQLPGNFTGSFNGYTGRSSVRPKTIVDRSGYGGTSLAARRYYRTVSMKYRLDLFEKRGNASRLQRHLDMHYGELERCYSNELWNNQGIRGRVVMSFVLNRKTQSFDRLKVQRSSLGQSNVSSCLNRELSHISVPIEKTMLGVITFDFNYHEGS